ncbi:MAG: phage tail tape measure protein [Bacteroidetes bacterium]|nr:MAG: phage tail tape measure protein [Bacteroidota bacterium]
MSDQANIYINLEGDIFAELRELGNQFKQLNQRVDTLDNTVTTTFNDLDKGAKRANQSMRILAYNAISDVANNLGPAFQNASEGTFSFDHTLRELSAITDVVGDDLDRIADSARANARAYGGDASASLRSYTILLSKLTPEIAQNPEALELMGDQVSVLARTMGGDAVGAVNAYSAAMNQFGIDLSDPLAAAKEGERIINTMVASAKVGSVEVPQLSQALEQSGAIADSANVSFSETNAALQVLGKFGKEGAEGGIALRNVLSILQRQDFIPERVREQLSAAGVSVDTLADKSLSLYDRLGELEKIGGNDALLSGMFGMENTVAIKGLLTQRDLVLQYTQDIEANTTAARQMSDTIGQSYQSTRDQITAYFNDIKLSMFDATGAALPFIDVTVGGLLSIVSVMPGIMAMAEGIKMLAASQKILTLSTKIAAIATQGWTIAQWALNAAFYASPIGWIVLGIGAIVGAIVYAWNHFEGFRAAIMGIWEATKQVFGNIADFIGKMLQPFFDAVKFIQEGEWGKAALALGKGLLNVATAPFQFVESLVKGEITEGVADAYARGDAAGRASFQSDQEEEDSTASVTVGGNTQNPYSNSSPTVDPAAPSSNATPSVTTGGTAGSNVRNNNISIKSLIETVNINNIQELNNIKAKLERLLIEVVRDSEIALSGN